MKILRTSSPSRTRTCAMLAAALALLGGCTGSSGPVRSSTSGASTPVSPSSVRHSLSLVAIGDSIPYNSPGDCPGCFGFVDRYAKAAEAAIRKPVTVTNLSQHTGLTLPQLLAELDQFRSQLAAADIVIVGVAHNSNELSAEQPCGAALQANGLPDWSRMTQRCATRSAARYRPQYDQLYSQIERLRHGKPTILRTINRYNDYTGGPGLALTAAANHKIKIMLDTWDAMLCGSATNHGFICADIYHAFNGPTGLTPSADLLGHDYTHPSNRGNARIAAILTASGFAPLTP